MTESPDTTRAEQLAPQSATAELPRAVRASDRYDATTTLARHYRSGEPLLYRGRPVDMPSEQEWARLGTWLKYTARRDGFAVNWTDHDQQLLAEMAQRGAWCRITGGESGDCVTQPGGDWVKAALADDAASGGEHLVPEFFDERVITEVLLHGELLPRVDMVEVPRGSTVDTANIGTPSVTWGHTEGTAAGVFDATGLVSQVQTSMHTALVHVEIGLEFLADAQVDVRRILQGKIAEAVLAELDKVIAVGDGVSQPQGIVGASGLTSVASLNGLVGPLAIDDAENLMFAVGKQFRSPRFRPAFVMTDNAYKSFRGIAVAAGDERRVLGLDYASYQLLENPVYINNDMSDSDILYGALSRYRLYRRQGTVLKWTDQGKSLSLANTGLLTLRIRYGGRVIDPAAFAHMNDAGV